MKKLSSIFLVSLVLAGAMSSLYGCQQQGETPDPPSKELDGLPPAPDLKPGEEGGAGLKGGKGPGN